MQKWIDLRDRSSGARLKMDSVDGRPFLFVVGLSSNSPRWREAVSRLGFQESPNRKFLIRAVQLDERIKVGAFRQVWPDAAYALMAPEQIKLAFRASGPAGAQRDKGSEDDAREIANELANARLLGCNADGDAVYENGAGRFVVRAGRAIVQETRSMRPSALLRAPDGAALDECADGFVRGMLRGEVQRSNDLARFIYAVTNRDADEQRASDLESAQEVIDAAVMRRLVADYETASDAFGDSVLLYETLPPYRGGARGKGAMPLPLSAMVQRLLGDTAGKSVVVPNAFDGAPFAFLPKGTRVHAYRGERDLSSRAEALLRTQRQEVTWHDRFKAAQAGQYDAMIFNADPAMSSDGRRQDQVDALSAMRCVSPGGRAVLVLAGDDARRPGSVYGESRPFLESLYARYQVEDAFDVARELQQRVGTDAALRIVILRNVPAPLDGEGRAAVRAPVTLPSVHTWDEMKARVDEVISRLKVREAESEGIDVERVAEEHRTQRPYIAFSKIGEASTMVPRELQAPMQAFLSDLESVVGPVDQYVQQELSLGGDQTLEASFSPEQVDGIATMVYRVSRGRSVILGDETGIGKGRALAAMAAWALKQGKNVVFITDRANLFSDLARDLRDINEWGRVRPFVLNSDGHIVDSIGEAGVLAQAAPLALVRQTISDNRSLEDLGANMCFLTYSQISAEESEKATWVKNQLSQALLIVDESHVAAGSDSNIATQILEATQVAWGVVYSSATWGKSSENLHIYARAFPSSVNVATLAQTMRKGGEAFSEIFSGMLAREGALIRREHDLSRLEFGVEVDKVNEARNNDVADKIAEVMSAMAFTAGVLRRVVTRTSDLNIQTLKGARDARVAGQSANIFKSRFGTGGMLYQVNRRVNAALNADNAVRLALEGFHRGEKPVIVFEDTGETFVRQALQAQTVRLANGDEALPSLVRPPDIRDLLTRMLLGLESVRQETVLVEDLPEIEAQLLRQQDDPETEIEGDGAAAPPVDADGVEAAEAAEAGQPTDAAAEEDEGIAVSAAGRAVAHPDQGQDEDPGGDAQGSAVRRKRRRMQLVRFVDLTDISEEERRAFQEGIDEIRRKIDALPPIALNAPDEMGRKLREAGLHVGELSGRSFHLLAQEGGLCSVVPRPRSKLHVSATVRAFNAGELDALMINRSAATGLSLHASPRFVDRRRRLMIEMQIPENPTDRIQLYGRVNRFDQVSFPRIVVASTGIYGELRQIMVQNKKLAELSANVRSSRESHALIKDVPDLLNPLGEEVARQFLQDNPETLSLLDMSAKDVADGSQVNLATRLTQRVPLLRLTQQRQVYEQLYAMFEDALVRAELSGFNPLKATELDIRAKMGPRRVLFGFDHQGLGSAFDGAAFAQAIEWSEDVRPMSLEAILEVVRVNTRRLVAEGKAEPDGQYDDGTPKISLEALAKRAGKQMEGRARLALAGSPWKTLEEAMAASVAKGGPTGENSPRRAMLRARWLAEKLPALVPGRLIEIAEKESKGASKAWWASWTARRAVVLDIRPPEDRRESQLAQWRVLTIAPGESRPVSTSLHAILGAIVERLDTDGGGAPSSQVDSQTLTLGGSLLAAHDSEERAKRERAEAIAQRQSQPGATAIQTHVRQPARHWMYEDFARRFATTRRRRAVAVTGNMYLASEWAAQTKAGKPVIFTSEDGLRHRAVILEDRFKPEYLRYLPVRLWTHAMIRAFGERLESSQERLVTLYTSFGAAWGATMGAGARDALMWDRDHGMALSVNKKDRRRVLSQLRATQKKIKHEAFGGRTVAAAEDPGHVVVSDFGKRAERAERAGGRTPADDVVRDRSRKAAGVIVLKASTPEQRKRVWDMLWMGPGLEVFVKGGNNPLAHIAGECVRDTFVASLRASVVDDPARAARAEEVIAQALEASDTGADEALGEALSALRSTSAAGRTRALRGQRDAAVQELPGDGEQGELDLESRYANVDFLTGEVIQGDPVAEDGAEEHGALDQDGMRAINELLRTPAGRAQPGRSPARPPPQDAPQPLAEPEMAADARPVAG